MKLIKNISFFVKKCEIGVEKKDYACEICVIIDIITEFIICLLVKINFVLTLLDIVLDEYTG